MSESIIISKSKNKGLNIQVQADTFNIVEEEGNFIFAIVSGEDVIEIKTDKISIQSLGLQFLPFLEEKIPQMSSVSVEEAYRNQIRHIKQLSDHSVQIILRELQSEVVVAFMWYMKDEELIRKIIANMSKRAGEMLFEDLQWKWSGCNPDKCSLSQAKIGRESTIEVINVVNRLVDEGQIENLFEE